jgi:HAD superfamily hydrolase (TIGR01509 family)
MIQALQAIVFDFDGVIVDSERLHLLSYQEVLAPLGLELSEPAYCEEYLGYDDVGVFRHYAKTHDLSWDDAALAKLIKAKAQRYDELSARGEMLFPGAAAFIRQAASAVPIAIASGALTHEVEEILQRTGLHALFVTIVGADQTARSKPSPDPYLEAFARIANASDSAIERSRTVAIEDSRWGLESAGAAGLRRVAVANTYSEEELAPHAELVVSGLRTLTLGALDELCAT